MDWPWIALAAFGWAAAALWIWRVAAGARSYRRAPRVGKRAAPAGARPASVLVPARDEESNIAACLESLSAQDYPDFEVIAVEDNSRDRTRELIAEAARRDPRIVPVDAPPTPEGWTGKNRALAAGAERARGEWLLFTDADARLAPCALSSAVAHAEERGLDLLSLLPRAIVGTAAERALQPFAMGYLGLWFPLDRVNRPGDPLAFANGQFLLFRRRAYEAIGGHAAVRGAYLEDVAFAREAKRRGMRVECALGKRVLGVRMYDSFRRAWRGWRRIYLHALDRRAGVLLGKAADLALLSAAPPALLLAAVLGATPGGEAAGAGRTGWIAAAGLALATALGLLFAGKACSAVGSRKVLAAFHPPAALVLAAILLDAARVAVTGAPTKWR